MKLGIVDTMFARVNMGEIALDELKKHYPDVEAVRKTVPGIKDLAVECKKLLDEGCDVCLALGMVGSAKVDLQCAHEASLGIMQAKLLTNKHIVEAFVHENEAWSEEEFAKICENRVRKHLHNAVWLVKKPEELIKRAGKGIRQGREDEGPIGSGRIKIGLVVSRFNREITEAMEKAALEELKNLNVDVKVLYVNGVFESPLAVKKLLSEKKDGVVVLGFVKKGETEHDRIVAYLSSLQLSNLSLEFNKPVGLGIIGPGATKEQAKVRKEEYAKRAVKAVLSLIKELKK